MLAISRKAITAASAGSLVLSVALAQQPAMPPPGPGVVQTVPPPSTSPFKLEPHTFVPPTPQIMELLRLEEAFADDVAKGGGPAFARWFADDGATLSNGQPPVLGRAAIQATATWRPEQYHLTWFVEGAGMGPSSDAGYTWGHYQTETVLPGGAAPKTMDGRYITFWKKVDGRWRVALEASADEPTASVPGSPSVPLSPR